MGLPRRVAVLAALICTGLTWWLLVGPSRAATSSSGPAINITLSVSPNSIPADGVSTSTATATVTDAQGNRVRGDKVTFTSSDPGNTIGQTVNNADGTYSAQITSSETAHQVTITASDQSTTVPLNAQATLDQTPTSSTHLAFSPAHPTTNQAVTLIAYVATDGNGPVGTVTFKLRGGVIAGCQDVPVSQSNPIATCQTAFAAANSPEPLSAVFTPPSGSNVPSSTGTASLTVGRDGTTTKLTDSGSSPAPGQTTTYTATVNPNDIGAAVPSGAVTFMDGNDAIPACTNVPLNQGSTSASATCQTSFAVARTHSLSVQYQGDANFLTSVSPVDSVNVSSARIQATMRWGFFVASSYTRVLSLVLRDVPGGSSVAILCHGGGCPFAYKRMALAGTSSKMVRSVDITDGLKQRQLNPGAMIRIRITQPGWIGKYYLFRIRSGRAPDTHIGCLAPGSTQPSSSC